MGTAVVKFQLRSYTIPMSHLSEVPGPNLQKGSLIPRRSAPAYTGGLKTTPLTRLESTIVDLYVRGLRRRQIARLLIEYLAVPEEGETLNQRMKRAVHKLRQLEARKWFRDQLWERSMIAADLRAPRIMAGVVRKAEEGRVDAAKLALSITGRHTEQGDVQATQVNIVFGADIPRPERHAIASPQEAEVDGEVEDAEWDD